MSREHKIVIGVYHGLTQIRCAIFNEQTNDTQVLQFINGQSVLNNCINYRHNPPVVGVETMDAISEVGRFIGLRFDDAQIQELINSGYFQFDIVEGADGYCLIEVDDAATGERRRLSPEAITADILTILRHEITRTVGLPDDCKIVATVAIPDFYTSKQKEAMLTAYRMANIEVNSFVGVSNAVIFGNRGNFRNGNCLILNVGRTATEVSVVTVSNDGKGVQIKVISGDQYLGEMDFDKELVRKVLELWQEQDPENDGVSMFTIKARDTAQRTVAKRRRLFKFRQQMERTKKELSKCDSVEIDVTDYGYNGDDYTVLVRREDFEDCTKDLIQKIKDLVHNTLRKSNIKTTAINQVIYIDEEAQMPQILEFMKEEFAGASFNTPDEPVRMVAIGAAERAHLIAETIVTLKTVKIKNNIYMKSIDGNMLLFAKGTQLPFNAELFVESPNGIFVLEYLEDDKPLGTFKFDIEKVVGSIVAITEEIDVNGVMTIKAFVNGQEHAKMTLTVEVETL